MKKENVEFYEKIINGKDVSDNITRKEGVVLEKETLDNSEYSVSSRSYYDNTTNSFSTHSATQKHEHIIEKIYVKFDDGKEEKITFSNKDSDIRSGSKLSFFYINNNLEYIKNNNTDSVIHVENIIFNHVRYENMALKINALLMGFLCAIPFLGTLIAFSYLFSYAPTINFNKIPLKQESSRANFIIFILSLGFSVKVYNDFNNHNSFELESVFSLYIALFLIIAVIRYITDMNIINKAKDFEEKVFKAMNL
jgi:hypothetical protein